MKLGSHEEKEWQQNQKTFWVDVGIISRNDNLAENCQMFLFKKSKFSLLRANSVTRWLDYSYNICPFSYNNSIKSFQSRFTNFCQIFNLYTYKILPKTYKKLPKTYKISPNLVTLIDSVVKGKFDAWMSVC